MDDTSRDRKQRKLVCDRCGHDKFVYTPGGYLPSTRHIYSCLECRKQIAVNSKGSRRDRDGRVILQPGDRARFSKRFRG